MSRLQRLIERMEELREASILAHNYQHSEDQNIANYVDDSVGLTWRAMLEKDRMITVFLTVDFMIETAATLNSGGRVLVPSMEARYLNAKLNILEKIYIPLMDEKYMVRIFEETTSKARRVLGKDIRIN
jgi:quinolinate synthase